QRVAPTAAVGGALIAVAGVALGIGAFLLLGHDEPTSTPTVAAAPTVSTAPRVTPTQAPSTAPASARPSASPPPRPVVVAPAPAPAAVPVLPVTVLNNSRITGLADRAAARFRAGGWPTPVVGNFRGRVERTTVYYAPGQQASAARFARQFGIGRVAPRFAGLPGSGLTVVLTRDYA
ncbi:MAG: LytR C-terminal domain-containing protein, partial [Mycobacteriales bacterium]